MPTRTPLFASRPILRFCHASREDHDDRLAVEEPLEIRVGVAGEKFTPLAVTMRTPGHDEDLAAGFCFTEGVVGSGDDIERVAACVEADYGNIVNVTLEPGAAGRRAGCVADATRQLYVSSSCGLCGKESIDRIERALRPIAGAFTVSREVLGSLPTKMRSAQPTFEATGGLHAAAVFSPRGELLVLREDVGRHNAVDKVIGHLLMLGRIPIDPGVLLLSGRSSFEIVQKAAIAGVAVIAAVGAPSTLAVDLAERAGITLIGFLREDRMNIYTRGDRISL